MYDKLKFYLLEYVLCPKEPNPPYCVLDNNNIYTTSISTILGKDWRQSTVHSTHMLATKIRIPDGIQQNTIPRNCWEVILTSFMASLKNVIIPFTPTQYLVNKPMFYQEKLWWILKNSPDKYRVIFMQLRPFIKFHHLKFSNFSPSSKCAWLGLEQNFISQWIQFLMIKKSRWDKVNLFMTTHISNIIHHILQATYSSALIKVDISLRGVVIVSTVYHDQVCNKCT